MLTTRNPLIGYNRLFVSLSGSLMLVRLYISVIVEYEETLAKDVDGKGVPLFNAAMLNEAIERKEKKYEKQGLDISNLILLVFDSARPDTIHWDIDPSVHQKSKFRGIYYFPKFSIRKPSRGK